LKVVLYARVSTADKGQDPGVQLDILRQMAKERSYEIVGEYVDYASGKDGNRPQFKQMMFSASKHQFDAILAVRLDRIMRSVGNLLSSLEMLHSYGVSVIFRDMEFKVGDPNDKLRLQIVAAIAEWEREIIRMRTCEGLAHARSKGKKLGRAYRDDVPIGEILRLRENKTSWKELSQKFGIPESTLRDHVRKAQEETINGKRTP